MPNQKYTDDADVTTLVGTEKSPIAIGGVDYYFTPTEMKTFVLNNYAGNGTITTTGVITSGTWAARFQPRIRAIVSSASPTPNGDTDDLFTVSLLAINATFATPLGTPTGGQVLRIRITSDGTPRTLAFSSGYRFSSGLPNPGTTTASKTIYFDFVYNANASKWDCILILDNF